LNLSLDVFYFATSIGHYFSSTIVYLTREFRPNDLTIREEHRTILRVDKLKESGWE